MSEIDWNKRLIEASVAGDLANIGYALQNNADINAKNFDGNTPLIISAERGHFDCLKFLIRQNADIEARNTDEETALMKAAFRNKTNCLKALLSANADIYATDNEGYNALMLTSLWKMHDAAKILIAAEPRLVNIKSKNNRTALDILITSTHIFGLHEKPFAEILIMAGAETRHIDPDFKRRYASIINALHEKKVAYRDHFNKLDKNTVKTIQTHANSRTPPPLKRRPRP